MSESVGLFEQLDPAALKRTADFGEGSGAIVDLCSPGAGFAGLLPGEQDKHQKSILPLISINRGSSTLVGRSQVVLPGVGLNVVFTEVIAALLVRL